MYITALIYLSITILLMTPISTPIMYTSVIIRETAMLRYNVFLIYWGHQQNSNAMIWFAGSGNILQGNNDQTFKNEKMGIKARLLWPTFTPEMCSGVALGTNMFEVGENINFGECEISWESGVIEWHNIIVLATLGFTCRPWSSPDGPAPCRVHAWSLFLCLSLMVRAQTSSLSLWSCPDLGRESVVSNYFIFVNSFYFLIPVLL